MDNPSHTSSKLFTGLAEAQLRTSVKWRLYDADVLPMFVAEMDVHLAPAIVSALTEVLEHSDAGYPEGKHYQQAVQKLAEEVWKTDTYRADLMALNHDVMNGVLDIIRELSSVGDTVIVTSPVYPPFIDYPKSIGRNIVESALTDDGRIDLHDLERVFADHANSSAVFLLCNPHNPTGAVHTVQELTEIAALSERYQIPVISDEIHAMLIDPGAKFVPYLSVAFEREIPSFSVFSASKSWNLAGLKAGAVIANPSGKETVQKLQVAAGKIPGHVAQKAHIVAMNHGREWVQQVMAEVKEHKQYFRERLNEMLPELRVISGDGTYLVWVDASALNLEESAQQFFLKHGRVAFNPGETFGAGGEGHIRVNLGTSREIIDEAISRMVAAVATLK